MFLLIVNDQTDSDFISICWSCIHVKVAKRYFCGCLTFCGMRDNISLSCVGSTSAGCQVTGNLYQSDRNGKRMEMWWNHGTAMQCSTSQNVLIVFFQRQYVKKEIFQFLLRSSLQSVQITDFKQNTGVFVSLFLRSGSCTCKPGGLHRPGLDHQLAISLKDAQIKMIYLQ